jgi:hypothetical protein
MKIGYYFSKTEAGGVFWPFGLTGKFFLARGLKKVDYTYLNGLTLIGSLLCSQ